MKQVLSLRIQEFVPAVLKLKVFEHLQFSVSEIVISKMFAEHMEFIDGYWWSHDNDEVDWMVQDKDGVEDKDVEEISFDTMHDSFKKDVVTIRSHCIDFEKYKMSQAFVSSFPNLQLY